MRTIFAAITFLIVVAVLCLGFVWFVNRIYVPEGYSLRLRYKGPFFTKTKEASPGSWALEDEVGVRQKLRGPGRHFYCPIWWERELIPDVVVEPGQVGIVTCKLGDNLPEGEFLVDGDIGETKFKGVLRKALGPGRYRINDYGYTVRIVETVMTPSGNQTKYSGWVEIPTGYVGVITNLSENPILGQKKGIQADVLPPGIYPINSVEQAIDIVEIGYRETTAAVAKARNKDGSVELDESGEPIVQSTKDGINFPSNDGFPISMDFTAIWGLLPEQAPNAVATFGNISQVENKIVQPQIASICRNNGSKYSAVQLLVGEDREKFQKQNRDEFEAVLKDKNINLLYGLVRHIYIPMEVRVPIQSANIADELKQTREQEKDTAKAEALYRQAEKSVGLETERVQVDTDRQYQIKLAEGDREAKTIDAKTTRLVAEIKRETAELKAQATKVLGQAENSGRQLVEEAKSDRFRLAVDAFGSAKAYNEWIFASGLPSNIDLQFLYAGEGTLWTDMKNSDFGIRANVPVNGAKPAGK